MKTWSVTVAIAQISTLFPLPLSPTLCTIATSGFSEWMSRSLNYIDCYTAWARKGLFSHLTPPE
jgi:hypothetical protein